jgi:hypothetical protein
MEITMSIRRKWHIAVTVIVLAMTIAPDVMAIVGRPLTPVSVAGVARRSIRR